MLFYFFKLDSVCCPCQRISLPKSSSILSNGEVGSRFSYEKINKLSLRMLFEFKLFYEKYNLVYCLIIQRYENIKFYLSSLIPLLCHLILFGPIHSSILMQN